MNPRRYLLIILFILFIVASTGCMKKGEEKTPQSSQPNQTEEYQTQPKQDEESQINYIKEDDSPKTISQFSTKILDKSSGRVKNLKLTSSKINGYVVRPGATFSFNRVVGEASDDRGFKKAKVLDEQGNAQIDDGGGVCQIRSTLYNAVRKAGLKITERHSHNNDVGYVGPGQDAAISYGNQDFKFINNRNYNIKIASKVDNNTVTISILKVK